MVKIYSEVLPGVCQAHKNITDIYLIMLVYRQLLHDKQLRMLQQNTLKKHSAQQFCISDAITVKNGVSKSK